MPVKAAAIREAKKRIALFITKLMEKSNAPRQPRRPAHEPPPVHPHG